MKNILAVMLLSLTSSCVMAWQPDLTGTDYERGEARKGVGAPKSGRVIYVREVTIQGTDNARYAGTAIGAAVGAVAGSRGGGSSSTRLIKSTVLGSVGGIAGGYVAERVSSERAQEIIVDHGNDNITTVVQSIEDGVIFKVGDRVLIIGVGGKTRVAPGAVK